MTRNVIIQNTNDTMQTKAKTIRRIIGITALVLWAIALAPGFFLGKNDMLIWQMDKWALLLVVVLTIILPNF